MIYNNEQRKRIFKVLEYIDEHLEDSLTLEKLSAISTYSPFHFQRMFKSIVGETPSAYVKRNRLENAAHLLIYEHHIPITQVALMCGFSSLSYFTYSFQSYFQTNPKKWREGAYLERFPREYEGNSKNSKEVSKMMKENKEHTRYNKFKWLDLAKVETRILTKCITVKNQVIGSYTKGIPAAWEEVFRWCDSRELLKENTLFLGIPRNNPYITPPEKSRYDCHIAISEGSEDENDEDTFIFNGGKHVVYEFEEPIDYSERNMLIECYSELYSYWLPKSGYKYLSNPVELITIVRNKNSLTLECKIKAIALAIEPK
ncbi:AraC family transcriptional regulator [Fictibacillus sp. BK138]|uniref:AraC family transcriptional regulator n=1 Tax=Fictibacillus sp. BK138 TaxID=2512121 RepID=UPI00102A0EC9|nr:AraC family transcriptional regulator [Fictibacillus sp. BK138]RZT21018.1 AraC family transcriptional regulator [Fictibacillus sp. BK138]